MFLSDNDLSVVEVVNSKNYQEGKIAHMCVQHIQYIKESVGNLSGLFMKMHTELQLYVLSLCANIGQP